MSVFRAIIVCALVRISAVGLYAGAPYLPPSNSPERLLAQASAGYAAARYAFATEAAQRALYLWQKPPRADFPAIAETLVLLGNIFMESGDPEGARQQYEAAYTLARGNLGAGRPALADALNGLGEYGYRRSDLTRAEELFRQALHIRMEIYGPAHEKTAAALNNIGNCQASAGRYAEAVATHRRVLELRRAILPPSHADLAVSLSNIGNCLYLSGMPEAALDHLQQALTIRTEALGPDHPKTAALYSSIGNCFAALDRPADALSAYETALARTRSALGREHPAAASISENLADLYFERGDYLIALDLFREAWHTQVRVFGESSVPALTLRHKIGLCHQYKGEYEIALAQHQSALAVLPGVLGGGHPLIGALHNNIGNCLTGMKNYPAAMEHYRAALRVFRDIRPTPHAETATALHNMGAAMLQAGDAAGALAAFEAAGAHIAGEDCTAKALSLKNRATAAMYMQRYALAQALIDSAKQLLPLCPSWVRAELQPAEGLLKFHKAQTTGDLLQMEQAAYTLDTALQHMETALSLLEGGEARAYGLARQLPLLRTALQAFFLLYEKSRDPKYLHRAYELSEADKSRQWAEMLSREMLDERSGIPDSISAQERELSAEINRLEKERLLWNDAGQIRAADLRIAELREQLRTVVQRASEAYPVYADLHRGIPVPSFSMLQARLLGKDQALIKYFDADSLWLVFVVTPDTATGLRLPKSEDFIRRVSALRQSLQGYIGAPVKTVDSLSWQYVHYASILHEELVRPLLQGPAGAKPHWVLIPDGTAAYLPFEALLDEVPDEPSLFKTHAYLLRTHQTAYAYSAAHWAMMEQLPVRRAKKTLAAFAPDFSGHPAGLPPLRYSRHEVRAAAACFKGREFTGAAAGSAAFLREAGQYAMLLLATHGKAGKTLGDMSYIAFTYTPGDTAAPVVYTRDLYAMRIPAELVVLSACETSVGEYRAGQGVISLGRGFFQAGARSVVATLWSVDDARHADIMKGFYHNLKAGQRKDEALRQAKLDYIAGRPHDDAHPAYWAGSTAWGNMRPLPFAGRVFWPWAVGLTAALIALFWRRIRRRLITH